jgi:toxin CptA
MHNAPSVNYPVGRSRLAGALLLSTWAAGVVAVAIWMAQTGASAIPAGLAWSTVLLSGLLAARTWARTPDGLLAWDGQTWTWSVGERVLEAHPEAVLDLQHALLLRLGEGRRASWLWLEKRALPARWDDLRRAVYSRARTEGSTGAPETR